jgi:hypothetical protein
MAGPDFVRPASAGEKSMSKDAPPRAHCDACAEHLRRDQYVDPSAIVWAHKMAAEAVRQQELTRLAHRTDAEKLAALKAGIAARLAAS